MRKLSRNSSTAASKTRATWSPSRIFGKRLPQPPDRSLADGEEGAPPQVPEDDSSSVPRTEWSCCARARTWAGVGVRLSAQCVSRQKPGPPAHGTGGAGSSVRCSFCFLCRSGLFSYSALGRLLGQEGYRPPRPRGQRCPGSSCLETKALAFSYFNACFQPKTSFMDLAHA